jgi:acyl-homoserine lactone acylase PvdQ
LRSFAPLVLCIALVATAAPAGAQGAAAIDGVRGYSVIPSGQSGYLSVSDLLGGGPRPNTRNQLGMYAGLIDDDDITEDKLSTYFHGAQLEPDEVSSEYTPRAGVIVERDSFGIPYVSAETDEGLGWGLGYVTAEDRLWQMDVLRHAATGRLAELLGPGSNGENEEHDEQSRRDGYTDEELQEMLDELPGAFGARGQTIKEMVEAYAEGVNAFIEGVRDSPTVQPVEHDQQGIAIRDWNPTDTIAIAVLQLRAFGETGGAEIRNAALLQRLQRRLGNRLGRQVFRDLLFDNHPRAPASVPAAEGEFPSQDLGPVDPSAVAIPDNAAQVLRSVSAAERTRRQILGRDPFGTHSSDAIVVAPDRSATGNPLAIQGPQLGYTAPALVMEVVGVSPSLAFRGPALPGASVLVPLGRGQSHAWSLTTGVSDAVDTRIEMLCDPEGGMPTQSATHYLFNGDCVAMDSRAEVIETRLPGGGASEREIEVHRTTHGPVVARATVGGAPVAVVRERHFWMREVDSIPSLFDFATRDMGSVEQFRDAVAGITMSFNVMYAGEDGIGYFHAGSYPLRAEGVDPLLPSWGTGEWEWTGTLPFEQQPQVIDPARGWVTNWNNKPSAGWDNGDATSWGPTHRVRLLNQGMRELLGDGDATLSGLVDVMREAATRDARAAYLGPRMLAMTRNVTGLRVQRARRIVERWISRGAHRRDRNGDGRDDAGAAVAIFDRWFRLLVRQIFDDELGNAYGLVRVPISDDPTVVNGSAFQSNFSTYLWDVLRPARRATMARNYCDDRSTARNETCRFQVQRALRRAVRRLTRQQDRPVENLTAPASMVRFTQIGAPHLVPQPIPWQNRGTYSAAMEIVGGP